MSEVKIKVYIKWYMILSTISRCIFTPKKGIPTSNNVDTIILEIRGQGHSAPEMKRDTSPSHDAY